MTKTSNYQLNQWEADDPIRRADFNADNAALDSALAALAASVGGAGNCRIATGSYVGDGAYDEDNPNRLTVDFKPLLVVVGEGLTSASNYLEEMAISIMMYPSINASGVTSRALRVTWGDTWVEWYCDSLLTAAAQNNEDGRTYYWIAFGVTE